MFSDQLAHSPFVQSQNFLYAAKQLICLGWPQLLWAQSNARIVKECVIDIC